VSEEITTDRQSIRAVRVKQDRTEENGITMGEAAKKFNEYYDPSEDLSEGLQLKPENRIVPDKQSVHMVLKRAALERLQFLQNNVYPNTKTNVVATALHLFDTLFREHEKGAVFFIQRPGEEPEVLKVFK